MVHQAGAYLQFQQHEVSRGISTPTGWDAGPWQGYPPALNSPVPIHRPGWRDQGTVRVESLAQEHRTMSLPRARTRSAQSRAECTNDEGTAPPPALALQELNDTNGIISLTIHVL